MVMDPLVGSAFVGAGASIVNSAANVLYGNYAYDKARKDALADIEKQNEYNHPKEQMKRLAEAGLNPRLVYGKGADVLMQPVRGTPPPMAKIDMLSGVSIAADLDNKVKQNKLIESQIANVDAQTANTKANTDVTRSNLEKWKEMSARLGINLTPDSPTTIKVLAEFVDETIKAGTNLYNFGKLVTELHVDIAAGKLEGAKNKVQNYIRHVRREKNDKSFDPKVNTTD